MIHNQDPSVSKFLALSFATLSRNLKSLALDCPLALDAFREFCTTHNDHFHNLEKLDIISHWTNIRCLDFKLPETLVELSIGDHPVFLDLPLSLLPPCLTRLSCFVSTLVLNGGESTAFRFPDTLTWAQIRVNEMKDWPKLIHLFPLGMEHLSISGYASATLTDHWTAISKFKSLRFLQLPIYFCIELEQAQLIPRSLEKLFLENMNVSGLSEESLLEILQALPQNLREVVGIWPMDISIPIAKHMPRTLEYGNLSIMLPEVVSFLPDSLTELMIRIGDYSCIASLPKRLQSLHLDGSICPLIDKLPLGLTSLTVNDEILNPEIASKLPPNLTMWSSSHLSKPIENIEDVFKALPATMTSLDARPVRWSPADAIRVPTSSTSSLHLPRHMKKLQLDFLDFSSSNLSEWVLGMPSNLKELLLSIDELQIGAFASFSTLPALNTLSIDVMKTPKGGWSQYIDFRSLPRNLSRLTVSDSDPEFDASDLTNDTFVGAPISLTSITLPNSPLVTEDCLQYISRVKRLAISEYGSNPHWF
jgi:hypothetical protein